MSRDTVYEFSHGRLTLHGRRRAAEKISDRRAYAPASTPYASYLLNPSGPQKSVTVRGEM